MKVKVTRSFSSIAKASDLHPRFYQPGDIAEDYAADVALAEGWGDKIEPDTSGDHGALAAGAAAAAASGATVIIPVVDITAKTIRARVKRAVDIPDAEGVEIRYAKGAVVAGDIAARLIEEGFAQPLDGGEEKAKGAAPENK